MFDDSDDNGDVFVVDGRADADVLELIPRIANLDEVGQFEALEELVRNAICERTGISQDDFVINDEAVELFRKGVEFFEAGRLDEFAEMLTATRRRCDRGESKPLTARPRGEVRAQRQRRNRRKAMRRRSGQRQSGQR